MTSTVKITAGDCPIETYTKLGNLEQLGDVIGAYDTYGRNLFPDVGMVLKPLLGERVSASITLEVTEGEIAVDGVEGKDSAILAANSPLTIYVYGPLVLRSTIKPAVPTNSEPDFDPNDPPEKQLSDYVGSQVVKQVVREVEGVKAKAAKAEALAATKAADAKHREERKAELQAEAERAAIAKTAAAKVTPSRKSSKAAR